MQASLIVIAVTFLFVGGIFVAAGGPPLLDAWRYRHAVTIEAIATGVTLRVATETSDTAYELAYRATLDGQPHERTEAVSVHLWERVAPGAVVHVRHLPGRPESVRLVTNDPGGQTPSLIFPAAGVVMILAGLAVAARAIRRRESSDESSHAASSLAVPSHASSRWQLARQSSDFWLGAISLLVATPIVAVTLLQLSEEWQFARSSVSTDGMILTKEIRRSGRGQRSRSYEATYRVMVPEGAFENRTQLTYDTWARLKEREAAEVRYLPERPARSRLAGSRPWMWPAFMALLGSVFFAMGATFLTRVVRVTSGTRRDHSSRSR